MTTTNPDGLPELTASMCPSSDYAKGWNDARAAMLAAAPAASGVDTSTNEAWAARAQEKIEAMEAATGGEDDMCPNCVTPWKCNGPHESTGGASVSERARELLAAEYSKCGMQQCAADIRSGVFAAAQQLAVNAIKAALEQKVPSGEVAIVCDWRDADPFPTFIEAEVGGKSISLEWRDRPDGLKELIVPVTDSALRALEQALTQQRATPQPSADAVREYDRELIARMLSCYDGGGYTDQAVAEQIRLLREADNLEADARTVVRATEGQQQNAAQGGGEK